MNTNDKDLIMSAVISLLDIIVIMKSGKDVIPKIVLVGVASEKCEFTTLRKFQY